MTKQEISEYQKIHKVYYPTAPSLSTTCSINYDWNNCSSKENYLHCRTCCNYNPLRMLYEHIANRVELGVPIDVLLEDCGIQLKKGEIL